MLQKPICNILFVYRYIDSHKRMSNSAVDRHDFAGTVGITPIFSPFRVPSVSIPSATGHLPESAGSGGSPWESPRGPAHQFCVRCLSLSNTAPPYFLSAIFIFSTQGAFMRIWERRQELAAVRERRRKEPAQSLWIRHDTAFFAFILFSV